MRRTSRTGCFIAAALALTAGCAVIPPPAGDHLDEAGGLGDCARLYRDVDAAVVAAGVTDAQAARIPGLPYLRLSRFLSAVAPNPDSDAFPAWVDRLRDLDRAGRRAEIANLPAGAGHPDWPQRLDACARAMRAADLAEAGARARLADTRPPDDYQPLLRVLGLYPVTSVPFLLGVRNLHSEIRETFATPLAELPVDGRLQRIGPATDRPALSPPAIAAMLSSGADNPLAIPEPSAAELDRLFRRFAPVWEIDTASPADRPGRPFVRAGQPPDVDGEPVVFTHVSHTRWQSERLLQLNYVLWFPARPRQGPLDMVGGHLDGITWRVTLGNDGRPLLYDVVHNCGCYYKAFPSPRLTVKTRRHGWEEPISVPQTVPDGQGRLVLRVAATTHYLQRIYREADAAFEDAYATAGYDELRSLPLPGGGRRSLFGPEGIVPGTERRERWLFWPMGVPEPGAMRQWGNHAIAFVGRRHFDDADLAERYFARAR